MRITLVCNCGLVLTHPEGTLLLDAVNGAYGGYCALPDAEYARMQTGGYGKICGILASHRHEDHYDAARVQRLAERTGAPAFVPDAQTPARVFARFGPFDVEFYRIPHMHLPDQPPCDHGVFVISDGVWTIYAAADADPDPEAHRAILAGRRIDAAFWSVPYLLYTETRTLMRQISEKSYVYHLPPAPDARGVRRKCARCMQRYAGELPGVTLLEAYPSQIPV